MMHWKLLTIVSLSAVAACRATSELSYPDSPHMDIVDDYHGTRVADPYRWLEDPDSPRTRTVDQSEPATESS